MKYFILDPNLSKCVIKAENKESALEKWINHTNQNEITLNEISEGKAEAKKYFGMEIIE